MNINVQTILTPAKYGGISKVQTRTEKKFPCQNKFFRIWAPCCLLHRLVMKMSFSHFGLDREFIKSLISD